MLIPLFNDRIYKGKIKDSNYKKHFLNILKKDKLCNKKIINNSNLGGYHSTTFFNNDTVLENILKIHTKDYISNFLVIKRFALKINNWWMIENKKAHSNIMHNHPFSMISGAIYLKFPENGGRIFFHNENQHVYSYGINKFLGDMCFQISQPVDIEEDSILLFPSYLLHSVEPNRSNKERIVLSFNLDMVTH